MQEVSVVLCNKNNGPNLKKLVPRLLQQTYDSLKIIIIDDNSTDDSLAYLEQLSDPKVEVISFNQPHGPGKKALLKVILPQIKSPWILLTDADCLPADHTWVEDMVEEGQKNDYEAVLGFGAYFNQSGWLNALIRYEGLWVAWQYFLAAKNGRPYGGVGRNLLVRQHVINRVSWHEELASGDDDFIVQAADKSAVGIQTSPSTFVCTQAPESLWAWIARKARHSTTAFSFSWQVKVQLVFWQILIWYWWILLIILFPLWPNLAYMLILLKIIWVVFWLRPHCNRFMQHDLWCKSPILEVLTGLLYLAVLPLSYWRDKKAWLFF